MTHIALVDRVSDLAPPVVAEMLQRARALEGDGASLVSLVRGEPDFATPSRICRAAIDAIERGKTHYPPNKGLPELCTAVAEKLALENGLAVDPATDVLITTGATMGLYLAMMATVNPGDEVLLPDPIYDAYYSLIRLAGGRPVPVPTERDSHHFAMPIEALESKITPRSRVLLLNTPWNPTGSVMTKAELEAVGEAALRHNLFIIVDEVYEKLIFDGNTHVSFAALGDELKSRSITVQSFSKTYAMTGWRLGYNVAHRDLINDMLRLYQQCSRGPATFVQWAGVEALRGPQDEVQIMAAEYARRRKLMIDGLSKIERAQVFIPEGTFFAFVGTQAFGLNSRELAVYLLNEAHVLTAPGQSYGSRGEGHIRFSFAGSSEMIELGLARISEALERLWLRGHPV